MNQILSIVIDTDAADDRLSSIDHVGYYSPPSLQISWARKQD